MDHIENVLRQWLNPLQGDWPELYMVGGAVRDHLLSRIPKDIDLMCLHAERFARRLAATRDAAVVPFQKKADEPCFRVADRNDPGSFVDVARMRGDTVITDLGQRDFTINAVAIQIRPGGILGDVVDPLNGARDIGQHLIRMTGPMVFSADPLRILRAVRFAASLGFVIEEKTLAAMDACASLITNTAAERILAELLEIFRTDQSAQFVRLMDHLGILDIIFPEIRALRTCTQNTYHHLDVWNHSLLVLEMCEDILNHLEKFFEPVSTQVSENLNANNRLPLLKLTAMLHDVGKPGTREVREPSGRITFYGHDKDGAEMVARIARRLRMSKRDHDFVRVLVAEHLHVLNLFFPKTKPTTRMRWFRNLKDDSIPIIIHGMADIEGSLGPASTRERRAEYLRRSQDAVIKYYGEIKKKLEHRSLVTGRDLIGQGMIPGPDMGRILRKVRDAQDTGQVKDREDALAYVNALRTKD